MPDSFPVVDDVVPYLIVADAAAALSFYVSGLGAVEDHRLTLPDGKIGHAEVRFGDRRVYVADEFPSEGHGRPERRPTPRRGHGQPQLEQCVGAPEHHRAADGAWCSHRR